MSVALVGWSVVACDDAETVADVGGGDDAALRRDSAPVDLVEAGDPIDDGAAAPPATCEKYCDLVQASCSGDYAQYGSTSECLAFCNHLPLVKPLREAEVKAAASVACRQYWADSPAQTDPQAYCLAAGPFGGGRCADRCTAFCDVVLSACSPDAGAQNAAPYESQPQCASACAAFSYRDAGAEGGGEGPNAPSEGDSLNCRLHQLRAVILQPEKCSTLGVESSVCKD